MTIIGTNVLRFKRLIKVAEIVLVMPHSKAELERLFIIVKKTKTDDISSLKLDGTLSSILSVKCHLSESSSKCYEWSPEDSILSESKTAAKTYNKQHSKKDDHSN